MKSSLLLSFILLLCDTLLVSVTAFTVKPYWQHSPSRMITSLYDEQQDDIGSDTAFEAPVVNQTSSCDQDDIAVRTNQFLESVGPSSTFETTETNAVNVDEEDEECEDQIFNPMSFWTERTGRFPRSQ
mmetsp:Transcript_5192/g.8198  ORF Transcript_5192/g.8198 Transcript_5192/m.8198 type:complete len:128 (+) Transcript_5192:86-469(+)